MHGQITFAPTVASTCTEAKTVTDSPQCELNVKRNKQTFLSVVCMLTFG